MWSPDEFRPALRSRWTRLRESVPATLEGRLGGALLLIGLYEGYLFVRQVMLDLLMLLRWPGDLLRALFEMIRGVL